MGRNAKIYTVFIGPGYDTARLHFRRSVMGPDGVRIPKSFLSNKDLLQKLRSALPDIEFVSRDLEPSPKGYDRLLMEIRELKDELDGVMLIGGHAIRRFALSDTEQQPLAFTGLPTIAVDNLFKLQPHPYETFAQKGKIITACVDREAILAPDKSEAMDDDLLGKIRIIGALAKMKRARILLIQDPQTEIDKEDFKIFPPKYNETTIDHMHETFGVEFITRDVAGLAKAYEEAGDKEAKKIAKMWIDESEGLKDTTEDEVVKSARLYLAIEEIIKECGEVSAVMIQGRLQDAGIDAHKSLPMMELQKRGVIACYQSYTGTTLAQMLAYYMVGRMSFVHDSVIDVFNNVTLHMHCGCPIRYVWGDKDLPYKIRDYTTGKWHEELKRRDGAVPGEVEFPVGVPATIWKVLVNLNEITVYTGTSIDGNSLYKEWDDIICRNKLALKVENAERIQNHRNVHKYGCHQTATFGDLRKKIKQLATFIGFDVVEEDVT